MKRLHTILKLMGAGAVGVIPLMSGSAQTTSPPAATTAATTAPAAVTTTPKVPTSATPQMIEEAIQRSQARSAKAKLGVPEQWGSEEPFTYVPGKAF